MAWPLTSRKGIARNIVTSAVEVCFGSFSTESAGFFSRFDVRFAPKAPRAYVATDRRSIEAVMQAPKTEARIMRYELTDHEIKPTLPNKPRGVPRVND
jgi:hypothetical protein